MVVIILGLLKPNNLSQDKFIKYYSAYMCGLCAILGKKFGILRRLLLTHDAITMAIILDNYNHNTSLNLNYTTCPKSPFKKFQIIESKNLYNVACLTLLSLRYKLEDDIRDKKVI